MSSLKVRKGYVPVYVYTYVDKELIQNVIMRKRLMIKLNTFGRKLLYVTKNQKKNIESRKNVTLIFDEHQVGYNLSKPALFSELELREAYGV